MGFKDTLNLPKTDFEMRANLSKKESGIIEKWNQMNLYKLVQEKNKDNELFFLHDGPPYANGNIHVGHALNKILKDFINRSKVMNGYNINFVPGWDTHGLPIEQKITESGVDRKSTPPSEFRLLCEKYALEQIKIQKEQMLRLGLIGRFDDPYITLTKEYEAKQLEVFFTMLEKGLIHKDLKPIYWSPSSESALAEAEIEYQDVKSPSIFVKFKVSKGNEKVSAEDNLVIWTTTPWTIPANVAVAVGESIDYTIVEYNGDRLVIAVECLEEIEKVLDTKFSAGEIFSGKEISGIEYLHPLIKRTGKVFLGHHVTTETGTGLVHMAPAHGEDDFYICKDNNEKIINYIDEKGYFFNDAPIAAGEFWLDSNKTIGIALDECGALLKLQWLKHAYPHDWRTKKPVMYRATPQWFGSVEKIKDEIISSIKDVKWIPSWGGSRLNKMMANRKDWCISRQRLWGVPIPIFYGENGEPIIDAKLNKHIIKLISKHGTNIWFQKESKDLLPKNYSHSFSPNGEFKKEMDIMDVWFDSGSSHYVISQNNGIKEPISMYLEGSDQYRGWFNSSLITSVAMTGKAPYKSVLSHGFVLDSKGEKMSKSKGNIVDPLRITSQKGADILRLWVSTTKYQADVRISDEIINQVSEYYRSIRFKIRFALSNLYDFDIKKDAATDFSDYDKYALMLIQKFNKNAAKWYEEYEFSTIISEGNIFLNEISANYFDFIKDILYITKPEDKKRRAIQTVLHHFVDTLLRVYAPILSFTTEEAYMQFKKLNKQKSVLLEDMIAPEVIAYDNELMSQLEKLILVKNDINKAIEDTKKDLDISKTTQCIVKVLLKDEYSTIKNFANLARFLIISEIIFENNSGTEYETAKIEIIKTLHDVCDRCRGYKVCVQDNICSICKNIIK